MAGGILKSLIAEVPFCKYGILVLAIELGSVALFHQTCLRKGVLVQMGSVCTWKGKETDMSIFITISYVMIISFMFWDLVHLILEILR